MKILFIGFNNIKNADFGGAQGTKRNADCLAEIADLDFVFSSKKTKLENIVNFFMSPNRMIFSRAEILTIKGLLKKTKYDYVFLDSSLLGGIAKRIYKHNPNIITFFHNVEIDFYKRVVMRPTKNLFLKMKHLVKKYCYRRNEIYSVKYSQKIIILNNRDLEELSLNYSKASGAWRDKAVLLPITLEDRLLESDIPRLREAGKGKPKGLFLGSFSPPNYEGVKWFVENVSEQLKAEIYIAGKGFETAAAELSRENVRVIGTTDEVKKWYYESDFVVSPIFSGSGMKVKTCEALMYGKTIFGTTEAFEGYELDYSKAGGLCDSAPEFITKINGAIENNSIRRFNEYSRNVFLEKYSNKSAKQIFEDIFK